MSFFKKTHVRFFMRGRKEIHMNKDFKRRVACEAIIFLALMALMFFITRLWLFIFLTVILLFIFVIRLLFLKPKPAVIEPVPPPASPEKPDTEQDILRRASPERLHVALL